MIKASASLIEDYTAVDGNGKKYVAGLVVAEDDKELRKVLGIDEFHPVLEVTKVEFHGTILRHPQITFT